MPKTCASLLFGAGEKRQSNASFPRPSRSLLGRPLPKGDPRTCKFSKAPCAWASLGRAIQLARRGPPIGSRAEGAAGGGGPERRPRTRRDTDSCPKRSAYRERKTCIPTSYIHALECAKASPSLEAHGGTYIYTYIPRYLGIRALSRKRCKDRLGMQPCTYLCVHTSYMGPHLRSPKKSCPVSHSTEYPSPVRAIERCTVRARLCFLQRSRHRGPVNVL